MDIRSADTHPATEPADGIVAVVIGASGGLGAAITDALMARSDVQHIFAVSRSLQSPDSPRVTRLAAEVTDPSSLARLVDSVRANTERVDLLITCIGILHGGDGEPALGPEKSLQQLDADRFARVMAVNALAPLQILDAFTPLLRRGRRPVAATLSAMVGSIGDNRLGGWYSYRMSKAALNMGLRTAAIELARPRGARDASGEAPATPIVVAVHPGTTATALSAPFLRNRSARSPEQSAQYLLSVLDSLSAADTGKFFNWDGRELPW